MLKRIQTEYIEAMKQKDKVKIATLRMLKSAITNRVKVEGGQEADLPEAEILAIIGKVLKQYKEELSFLKADTDKYAETKQGVEILAAYLPRQLTPEEISKAVDDLFDELPAEQRNLGAMMKIIKERLGSQADMKAVSGLVKAKLS